MLLSIAPIPTAIQENEIQANEKGRQPAPLPLIVVSSFGQARKDLSETFRR
jgi:hypothetical protein